MGQNLECNLVTYLWGAVLSFELVRDIVDQEFRFDAWKRSPGALDMHDGAGRWC